jgi:hypothetical protein
VAFSSWTRPSVIDVIRRIEPVPSARLPLRSTSENESRIHGVPSTITGNEITTSGPVPLFSARAELCW